MKTKKHPSAGNLLAQWINKILAKQAEPPLPPKIGELFDKILAPVKDADDKQECVILVIEKILRSSEPLLSKPHYFTTALGWVVSDFKRYNPKKRLVGESFDSLPEIEGSCTIPEFSWEEMERDLSQASPLYARFTELILLGYTEKEILGNPPQGIPSMLEGWKNTPSAWRPCLERDKTREIRQILADHV